MDSKGSLLALAVLSLLAVVVFCLPVGAQLPPGPTLVTPENNENTNDNTPYFSWSLVTGVDENYRIVICRDNNGSPARKADNTYDNIYDSWLTENYDNFDTHPGNALPDGLWWWGVRVENQRDNTATMTDWTFYCLRVDTVPPAAPILVSPANGENLKDNTPTLSWRNVSENSLPVVYKVWISTDNLFQNVVRESDWLSDNYWVVTHALLDGVYYWRVCARDDAGNVGENSDNWSFRVDTLPPADPQLRRPGHGAWVNTLTPTLEWNPVTENSFPVLYRVEVDTTPSFNSPNKQTSDWVASTSWTTPPLSEGTWYWRVTAKDNAGNVGNPSSPWTFMVDVTPPSTPTISSSTHPRASPTSNPNPIFSWNAVGGPSPVGYQYKLEGYDTDWKSTTNTSVSYTNVPDGYYTFKLRAIDTGGTSETAEYTILIDTTPSSVTLTGISATETATGWIIETNLSPFILKGTVEPGSRVTVNGLPVSVRGDGSFSATYDLSAGQNRFVIRVVDPAGNVTERTLLVYYSGGAPPAVTGPTPASSPIVFLAAVVLFIVVLVGVVLKLR